MRRAGSAWGRRIPLSPLAMAGLALLAGLNLGGLLWLARAMSAPEPVTVAAAGRAGAEQARAGMPIPQPRPASAYPATLSRPLFLKTRQPYAPPPPPPPPKPQIVAAPPAPPPPPPPPAPPAPPPEPDVMLAGVSISGGMRKAYLVPKGGSGEGRWVAEGEMVQGWRVSGVLEDGVGLENAGRTVELPLYESARK